MKISIRVPMPTDFTIDFPKGASPDIEDLTYEFALADDELLALIQKAIRAELEGRGI